MTKFSDVPAAGITIRESANDGSDFTTNTAADYRRLFLGEDGKLHLKDSAGTVTDIAAAGGAVATDAIWDAKGDLAGGTGADTASRLAVGADTSMLVADSAAATGLRWGYHGSPTIVQSVSAYQASSTTNALTVAVATKALFLTVQSETRGAASITHTNVTWTQRYTASSGTNYFEVWTGALTGAAGTTCTVNFASATKSNCTMVEVVAPALTAVGTPVTSTTGILSLGGETDGALVVFGETCFNANTVYIVSNAPYARLSAGVPPMGLCRYKAPGIHINMIQSAAATRFSTIMRIS